MNSVAHNPVAQVAQRAGSLVSQGYHWSEATVLAVGEHLWGHVDDGILRMTSGLAGGVGCSHQELCGALSGGVLIIGALYGRVRPDEDDSDCQELAAAYRERFVQTFGATRCADLRAGDYGPDGQ